MGEFSLFHRSISLRIIKNRKGCLPLWASKGSSSHFEELLPIHSIGKRPSHSSTRELSVEMRHRLIWMLFVMFMSSIDHI